MNPLTRPNTLDRDIWQEVFDNNEYRVRESLEGDIVIDVGAHIGAFSSLCKSRGAKEIYAVEMSFPNLNLAMHNVADTPGKAIFHPFHAAAWRSDVRGARLVNGGNDGRNTGGSWALPYQGLGEEVPTIPFDDLVKLASDFFRRRVNLVKFDCEGAEWPILFTSQTLTHIDRICGEYHAAHFDTFKPEQKVKWTNYSIPALHKLLEGEGFDVHIEEPNEALYAHFWASR